MKKAHSVVYKMTKQFAYNFTPTFQSSTLLNLCNFPTEKTEIGFVLNYWPFAKYKQASKTSSSPQKKSINTSGASSSGLGTTGLRTEDKHMIRNELSTQFASGSLNFNDQSLMSKISENLSRPDGFQPEMDEDSNEIKVNIEKKRIIFV